MKVKRAAAVVLAMLLPCGAMAEHFTGHVTAADVAEIKAPCAGTLQSLTIEAGQRISEDTLCGSIAPEKVFASEDGTVERVIAETGEKRNGEVLVVTPVSRYTIHCSASNSYSNEDMMYLRNGDWLWVKCTQDGSHIAFGRVFGVQGKSFKLEVTAGELYIGEAVGLYRSPDCEDEYQAGVGTVAHPEDRIYTADGYILSMRTTDGAAVERGQLLFTYGGAEDLTITSGIAGVVTELCVRQGDQVAADTLIARTAQRGAVTLEISEQDTQFFALNDRVELIRADDPEERKTGGIVSEITSLDSTGSFTVTIKPDEDDLPIGMTMEINTLE